MNAAGIEGIAETGGSPKVVCMSVIKVNIYISLQKIDSDDLCTSKQGDDLSRFTTNRWSKSSSLRREHDYHQTSGFFSEQSKATVVTSCMCAAWRRAPDIQSICAIAVGPNDGIPRLGGPIYHSPVSRSWSHPMTLAMYLAEDSSRAFHRRPTFLPKRPGHMRHRAPHTHQQQASTTRSCSHPQAQAVPRPAQPSGCCCCWDPLSTCCLKKTLLPSPGLPPYHFNRVTIHLSSPFHCKGSCSSTPRQTDPRQVISQQAQSCNTQNNCQRHHEACRWSGTEGCWGMTSRLSAKALANGAGDK